MKGLILQQNHFVSNGLVDGYQHLAAGKERYDHHRRLQPRPHGTLLEVSSSSSL